MKLMLENDYHMVVVRAGLLTGQDDRGYIIVLSSFLFKKSAHVQ